MLETLRAPLLLSPTADVLAGYCVARALQPTHAAASLGSLSFAALAGSCLLAAGMAQNALADREDDRRRKPQRPIPRGALGVGAVRALFTGLTLAGLGAAAALPGAWRYALAIVLASATYHYVAKRWRLPGCLLLGLLRGLDMSLGVLAAGGALALTDASAWRFALTPELACMGYGAYIACASLHASTDDEAGGTAWSRIGLGGATTCLVLLLGLVLFRLVTRSPEAAPGAGLAATAPAMLLSAACASWALLRLLSGWRRLRPGPLTGVALSNLYLIDAALCFAALGSAAGLGCLLLFAASRRLLAFFPPT